MRDFALATAGNEPTDVARAVKLFYALRYGIRDDPFSMRLDPANYVAIHVPAAPSAYCLPKTILLAAAARALGIPYAIGLSDVVNRLSTEELKSLMGGTTCFMGDQMAADTGFIPLPSAIQARNVGRFRDVVAPDNSPLDFMR